MKSKTHFLKDLILAKLNSNLLLVLVLVLFTNSLLAQITKRTTTSVNLRSSPNANSEIMKIIPANTDVIAVYEWDENWTQVNSMESIGYVSSKYLTASDDPYQLWKKVDYSTGEEPECENIQSKYDQNSLCKLTINMMYDNDCVVKLMRNSYGSAECIRIAYVRGGDQFTMKNIPFGSYYLKLAYGKDFRQGYSNQNCIVRFTKNALYEKSSDVLEFNQEDMGDYINFSTYEIKLGVKSSSKADLNNLNTKKIDEKTFNN